MSFHSSKTRKVPMIVLAWKPHVTEEQEKWLTTTAAAFGISRNALLRSLISSAMNKDVK